MANRRVGVEYSPSTLEPVRPGAVSPDRALCLPTFSHFVIVNKTSLSLFLLRIWRPQKFLTAQESSFTYSLSGLIWRKQSGPGEWEPVSV